jgi:hypothetical protein
MATPQYNANNPKPQSGSGAYGAVPGVLNIPQNTYGQVNNAFSGYGATGQNAANFIGGEVQGQLSPETMDLLQNKGAQYGVMSGSPGSQFANNNYLKNLGLTSEQVQGKGVQDYLGFLGGTGAAMTDPKLAYEVQLQNALDAAAPNPAAAAGALMGATRSGYGSTVGGNFNMPWQGGSAGISPSTATSSWYAPPQMAGYGPGYGTPDAPPVDPYALPNSFGGTNTGYNPAKATQSNFEDVYSDYGSLPGESDNGQQSASSMLDDYFQTIYQD